MLLAKNCTSDRLTYLKHVHEAREKEVNTCENPQSHQFKMAVAERGTHTLNANVSVGAISRGKDASDSLPEGRDGGSRPADTAKEEHINLALNFAAENLALPEVHVEEKIMEEIEKHKDF